jgi:hypothetical protein
MRKPCLVGCTPKNTCSVCKSRERGRRKRQNPAYRERNKAYLAVYRQDPTKKQLIEAGKKRYEKTEKYKVSRRQYFRKLRAESPQYKLTVNLRRRLVKALKAKNATRCARSFDLLGCQPYELRTHLERLFSPGMTWENYGTWHMDHIRPLASFDLQDPEQQKIAFHFSNIQPLWGSDNIRKGARI